MIAYHGTVAGGLDTLKPFANPQSNLFYSCVYLSTCKALAAIYIWKHPFKWMTFEIPEDRHIMSADDGIITVMDLTPPRRKRPDRGGKLIRAMSSSMMKREISWEAFSIRNIPPAGSL